MEFVSKQFNEIVIGNIYDITDKLDELVICEKEDEIDV